MKSIFTHYSLNGYYHLQRSCCKVMFSQASVTPSPGQPPPGQAPPLDRHPPGQTPPRQTPWADTPRQTPPGPTPPPKVDQPPSPPETATAADGMHPTGIHSCNLPTYLVTCPQLQTNNRSLLSRSTNNPVTKSTQTFSIMEFFLCGVSKGHKQEIHILRTNFNTNRIYLLHWIKMFVTDQCN